VNPGELIVNAMPVLEVRLPDVPVIATVAFPGVALLLAVSVNVLPVVAGLGEKDAVTPLGRPDADSVTFPLNPYCGLIEMLDVEVAPSFMLMEPG
jgi:hypothetical protein